MGIVAGLKRVFCRSPDYVVGDPNQPYLRRWWIIPRNRLFNVYLHQFCRDDDDRALHDHPWVSLSIVLRGGYFDITPGPDASYQRRWYGPGAIVFRFARSSHRVELSRYWVSWRGVWYPSDAEVPAWTLFLTGPRIREWGFHCPNGWRHWKEFTGGENGELVGKGCD